MRGSHVRTGDMIVDLSVFRLVLHDLLACTSFACTLLCLNVYTRTMERHRAINYPIQRSAYGATTSTLFCERSILFISDVTPPDACAITIASQAFHTLWFNIVHSLAPPALTVGPHPPLIYTHQLSRNSREDVYCMTQVESEEHLQHKAWMWVY
jgi:hypothetical protein